MERTEAEEPVVRKKRAWVIGFMQGVLLLLLHMAITKHSWIYNQPQWLLSLYTIVIGSPIILLFSLRYDSFKKTFIWVGGVTVVFGALGYYVGQQAIGISSSSQSSIYFSYALMMSIAALMFLMFLQQHSTQKKISYSSLFKLSWSNFIIIWLACFFTLAVWGVLMLWSVIFEIIDVRFFYNIFTDKYFYYPVLALSTGFAITILQDQVKVIGVLTHILQVLMKYLLLMVVLGSVIFLFALIFTGLTPLWDTRFGSGTLLWMQALLIFMLNATYQDHLEEWPFGVFLHRFIYFGVALLPLYSVIIGYGLFTRIAQYGWTVGRCYGIMMWTVFTLFSLSYCLAIIRKRDHWVRSLSFVNIRMGFMVFVTLLAVNSPLVDFRKITISNQLSRLKTGEVPYDKFDFHYFDQYLGAAGREALLKMKDEISETHPKISQEIENVLFWRAEEGTISAVEETMSFEDFTKNIIVHSDSQQIPDDLKRSLYFRKELRSDKTHIHIYVLDLNNDGQKDYLIIGSEDYVKKYLVSKSNGQWRYYPLRMAEYFATEKLIETLKAGKIEIIPYKWNKIKIGGAVLEVGQD